MSNNLKQLDAINEVFKLPISYNKSIRKLNNIVVNDLELVTTVEKTETSIYENVFKPQNRPAKKIVEQFASQYTTDVAYLNDTQKLIKSLDYNNNLNNFEVDNIVSLWEEIQGETSFCEKYLYVDWSFAKNLNNNAAFLQIMSIYNVASPILSLCLPIFVLIVPFFIIKIKGIELNIKEYIDILKLLISNHAISKLFTKFHEVDFGQKIYILLSAAFYLFSIYQNILICIRFYSNMQKMHNYLNKFKNYIDSTLELMNYHLAKSNQLTNYTLFNDEVKLNMTILAKFKNDLEKITPFKFSFNKITELGHIMHTFYQLYDNQNYNKALLYSFGFHGYFSLINNIKLNIDENKINVTQFIKDGKPEFKQMYYPKFINEKSEQIIKNNCDLNKNMIITGPNASGKTTTLKTALINIILSQQIGYGCFELCKLTPYDNIHCYLNIPDTSGRDSLFQAEARRCKEIINSVEENKQETHFCIFDELYSGTNPEEAVGSAFAFMDYIVKKPNVTCILTTHYVKLCKKLAKNSKIKNYNMQTLKKNDNFEYTYLIQKGISKIKGGLKVLQDMDYPKEILDNTN